MFIPLVRPGRGFVHILGLLVTSLCVSECIRDSSPTVSSKTEHRSSMRQHCSITEAASLIPYNVSFFYRLEAGSVCSSATCSKFRFEFMLSKLISATVSPIEGGQQKCLCAVENELLFHYFFDGEQWKCDWSQCWAHYSTIMALGINLVNENLDAANYLWSQDHWEVECIGIGRTFLPPLKDVAHQLHAQGRHDVLKQISDALGYRAIIEGLPLCDPYGIRLARASIVSRLTLFRTLCQVVESDVTTDGSGQLQVSSGAKLRLCEENCQEMRKSWKRPDIDAALTLCPPEDSLTELQPIASLNDVIQAAWSSCQTLHPSG